MLVKNEYISCLENKLNHERQIILLIISDKEGWLYLAVKKLSALLNWITSAHVDDFYCLNGLHSFRAKKQAWIS